MNLFEEIRKLDFPDGEYVVVGSGIMAAKGLREAQDLDMVVTPALFKKCENEGWEKLPWTKPGMLGKEWLKRGNIEIYVEMNHKGEQFTVERLFPEAEVIQNIPFLSLERLIVFKREYGREKDFKDIKLIEEYLAR